MAEQRFALRGEIDLLAARDLRTQLLAFVNTTTGDVVLDCDGLTFIDSVGIAILLTARRVLRIQGRHMRVVNLRGLARHATDALGITDMLTIADLEPA
jgi:anti-anti-sigma factor